MFPEPGRCSPSSPEGGVVFLSLFFLCETSYWCGWFVLACGDRWQKSDAGLGRSVCLFFTGRGRAPAPGGNYRTSPPGWSEPKKACPAGQPGASPSLEDGARNPASWPACARSPHPVTEGTQVGEVLSSRFSSSLPQHSTSLGRGAPNRASRNLFPLSCPHSPGQRFHEGCHTPSASSVSHR